MQVSTHQRQWAYEGNQLGVGNPDEASAKSSRGRTLALAIALLALLSGTHYLISKMLLTPDVIPSAITALVGVLFGFLFVAAVLVSNAEKFGSRTQEQAVRTIQRVDSGVAFEHFDYYDSLTEWLSDQVHLRMTLQTPPVDSGDCRNQAKEMVSMFLSVLQSGGLGLDLREDQAIVLLRSLTAHDYELALLDALERTLIHRQQSQAFN